MGTAFKDLSDFLLIRKSKNQMEILHLIEVYLDRNRTHSSQPVSLNCSSNHLPTSYIIALGLFLGVCLIYYLDNIYRCLHSTYSVVPLGLTFAGLYGAHKVQNYMSAHQHRVSLIIRFINSSLLFNSCIQKLLRNIQEIVMVSHGYNLGANRIFCQKARKIHQIQPLQHLLHERFAQLIVLCKIAYGSSFEEIEKSEISVDILKGMNRIISDLRMDLLDIAYVMPQKSLNWECIIEHQLDTVEMIKEYHSQEKILDLFYHSQRCRLDSFGGKKSGWTKPDPFEHLIQQVRGVAIKASILRRDSVEDPESFMKIHHCLEQELSMILNQWRLQKIQISEEIENSDFPDSPVFFETTQPLVTVNNIPEKEEPILFACEEEDLETKIIPSIIPRKQRIEMQREKRNVEMKLELAKQERKAFINELKNVISEIPIIK